VTRRDGTETGSWYGNDTIWRTCIDLNRILLYASREGEFEGREPDSTPRRRVLHVVDGIVGGDGDGPLVPRPRPSGVVLCGANSAYVDLAAAALMGLAWKRIPLILGAFAPQRGVALAAGDPGDLELVSDAPEWSGTLPDGGRPLPKNLAYRPAPGWEGVLSDEGQADAVPLLAASRKPGLLWRGAKSRVPAP
jgi:hypothetical protein